VQNVDTLSRLPEAVRRGAAFARDETLTVTLWGDVHSPGAYDVKVGRTFRSVIETEGGGPTLPIGLVFPNGAQAMPLTASQLDLPIDPAALAAQGIALGTASILVLDHATSRPAIVESIARFFERESCGQCPPCVLGTTNLRQLVTGDRPATIRLTPKAAVRETASFMSIHGYCGHSRSGATAVSRLFEQWSTEVLDHLRGENQKVELRNRDPFAKGSGERAALDAFLERV
jgi:NADH-quinone oxidoreductase subunit F